MNLGLSATPLAAANPLEQGLADFRASHPPRLVSRRGVEWAYYVGGSGDRVILRLTGALGLAEFSFQQIQIFERRFRVIAPDYPALATLEEMTDGLIGILDAEHVERAHVIGGSFGGMLAQALVRRAPDRVASLVLSHTGAPDGRRRRLATRIVSALPVSVLRKLLKARLGRTLDAADPFWRRYFDTAIERMTKADVVSRVRLQAEFACQRGWGPGDLERWPGRVLLLEGDDDPLFPPAARGRLRALYPSAEVHRFAGTGHAAAVLKPEEYAEEVARFLLNQRPQR
jgi:pimeloyl-ACP methyl ester carboxylesterase